MNTMTTFRLTFNLPAQKFFFEGDEIEGVRIRIEDGKVAFKATNTTRGNDCVGFVTRPRGGYEIPIDGEMADELLTVLMQEATVNQPFFMLKRTTKGWIEIEHFASDKAPPKFTPHVRVWMPREKINGDTSNARSTINDEISGMLGDFSSVVRTAKRLVSEYEQTRKIGRPPREIVEARDVLIAFEQFSREILPETRSADDVAPLLQVADILNSYLRARSETKVAEKFQEAPEVEKPAKTGRGRPKGSRNKARIETTVEANVPNFTMVDPPIKRGRGRPKGSLNKKVNIIHTVPTTEMIVTA